MQKVLMIIFPIIEVLQYMTNLSGPTKRKYHRTSPTNRTNEDYYNIFLSILNALYDVSLKSSSNNNNEEGKKNNEVVKMSGEKVKNINNDITIKINENKQQNITEYQERWSEKLQWRSIIGLLVLHLSKKNSELCTFVKMVIEINSDSACVKGINKIKTTNKTNYTKPANIFSSIDEIVDNVNSKVWSASIANIAKYGKQSDYTKILHECFRKADEVIGKIKTICNLSEPSQYDILACITLLLKNQQNKKAQDSDYIILKKLLASIQPKPITTKVLVAKGEILLKGKSIKQKKDELLKFISDHLKREEQNNNAATLSIDLRANTSNLDAKLRMCQTEFNPGELMPDPKVIFVEPTGSNINNSSSQTNNRPNIIELETAGEELTENTPPNKKRKDKDDDKNLPVTKKNKISVDNLLNDVDLNPNEQTNMEFPVTSDFHLNDGAKENPNSKNSSTAIQPISNNINNTKLPELSTRTSNSNIMPSNRDNLGFFPRVPKPSATKTNGNSDIPPYIMGVNKK